MASISHHFAIEEGSLYCALSVFCHSLGLSSSCVNGWRVMYIVQTVKHFKERLVILYYLKTILTIHIYISLQTSHESHCIIKRVLLFQRN